MYRREILRGLTPLAFVGLAGCRGTQSCSDPPSAEEALPQRTGAKSSEHWGTRSGRLGLADVEEWAFGSYAWYASPEGPPTDIAEFFVIRFSTPGAAAVASDDPSSLVDGRIFAYAQPSEWLYVVGSSSVSKILQLIRDSPATRTCLSAFEVA